MTEISDDRSATMLDDKTHQTEILKKRAAAIASARVDLTEPESRLIVFRLGNDLFGVPLEAVRVVHIIRRLTPLPGVPLIFAGLLAIRGGHVTALDLVRFLEPGASGRERHLADATKAVVVGPEGREIAILAEELEGIQEIFAGDVRSIEGAPEGAPISQLGPEGIQIIDVPALLADPRLHATRTEK